MGQLVACLTCCLLFLSSFLTGVADCQFVCACTTPDCTLSGADICKVREFCYSRVRATVGSTVQLIEKGCVLGWMAERACRDQAVSMLDEDTYQVCCTGHWCNGVTLERLPHLQQTTTRSMEGVRGAEAATEAPSRVNQVNPAFTGKQLFAAPSASVSSSIMKSPIASQSASKAASAAASAREDASPTESSAASLSSLEDDVGRQSMSVLRQATPSPSQSVRRSQGNYPLDAGVSDLVHPVYIAVPVMSLCLIVTALAALVLVIRRREQLECPPEQRQQQQQQQRPHQPQQQQYSMYFRNSLLTPETRRSHQGHLLSWCQQPEQQQQQLSQQSQQHPQCRRPLLACNGVGPDPSCHSQLNDLA